MKDGIRAGPISALCTLFKQVLVNFEAFDQELVNDILQVIGELIDWNDLEHFGEII
jgi:hypothetical protein